MPLSREAKHTFLPPLFFFILIVMVESKVGQVAYFWYGCNPKPNPRATTRSSGFVNRYDIGGGVFGGSSLPCFPVKLLLVNYYLSLVLDCWCIGL
jgi:hypothetical protein